MGLQIGEFCPVIDVPTVADTNKCQFDLIGCVILSVELLRYQGETLLPTRLVFQ